MQDHFSVGGWNKYENNPEYLRTQKKVLDLKTAKGKARGGAG